MRIGIDIDGVLTDIERFSVDYFSKYCVENGIDFNIKEMSYDLNKAFGVSAGTEDKFWSEWLEYYSINEKARPFAAEVIKKLKNEGHEIYIITARFLANRDDDAGEHMRGLVKNWLAENGIVYDKLIFSKANNQSKVQEIADYKIDVMIEDNPSNIIELSNLIPVICYNASYNMYCKGTNIISCFSWYDIYKKISELNK